MIYSFDLQNIWMDEVQILLKDIEKQSQFTNISEGSEILLLDLASRYKKRSLASLSEVVVVGEQRETRSQTFESESIGQEYRDSTTSFNTDSIQVDIGESEKKKQAKNLQKPPDQKFQYSFFVTYKTLLIQIMQKAYKKEKLSKGHFDFLYRFFKTDSRGIKLISYPDQMVLATLNYALSNNQMIPENILKVVCAMCELRMQKNYQIGYFTMHKTYFIEDLKMGFEPPLSLALQLYENGLLTNYLEFLKKIFTINSKGYQNIIYENKTQRNLYVRNQFPFMIQLFDKISAFDSTYNFETLKVFLEEQKQIFSAKSQYQMLGRYLPQYTFKFMKIKGNSMSTDELEYLVKNLSNFVDLEEPSFLKRQSIVKQLKNYAYSLGIIQRLSDLQAIKSYLENVFGKQKKTLSRGDFEQLAGKLKYDSACSEQIIQSNIITVILKEQSYNGNILPQKVVQKLFDVMVSLPDRRKKKQLCQILILQYFNWKIADNSNFYKFFKKNHEKEIDKILSQGKKEAVTILLKYSQKLIFQKSKAEQLLKIIRDSVSESQDQLTRKGLIELFRKTKKINKIETFGIDEIILQLKKQPQLITLLEDYCSENGIMSKQAIQIVCGILAQRKNVRISQSCLNIFCYLAENSVQNLSIEVILNVLSVMDQEKSLLNHFIRVIKAGSLRPQFYDILSFIIQTLITIINDTNQQKDIKANSSFVIKTYCENLKILSYDELRLKKARQFFVEYLPNILQVFFKQTQQIQQNIVFAIFGLTENKVPLSNQSMKLICKYISKNERNQEELLQTIYKNVKGSFFKLQEQDSILLSICDIIKNFPANLKICCKIIVQDIKKRGRLSNQVDAVLVKQVKESVDFCSYYYQIYKAVLCYTKQIVSQSMLIQTINQSKALNSEGKHDFYDFMNLVCNKQGLKPNVQYHFAQIILSAQGKDQFILLCCLQKQMKFQNIVDQQCFYVLEQIVMSNQKYMQIRQIAAKCLAFSQKTYKISANVLLSFSLMLSDIEKTFERELLIIIKNYFKYNFRQEQKQANQSACNQVQMALLRTCYIQQCIQTISATFEKGRRLSSEALEILKDNLVYNSSDKTRQLIYELLQNTSFDNETIKSYFTAEKLMMAIMAKQRFVEKGNEFIKYIAKNRVITFGILKNLKHFYLEPTKRLFYHLIKKAMRDKIDIPSQLISFLVENSKKAGIVQHFEVLYEICRLESSFPENLIQIIEEIIYQKAVGDNIYLVLLDIICVYLGRNSMISKKLYEAIVNWKSDEGNLKQKKAKFIEICNRNYAIFTQMAQVQVKMIGLDKDQTISKQGEKSLNEILNQLQLLNKIFFSQSLKKEILQTVLQMKTYQHQIKTKKKNISSNFLKHLNNSYSIGPKLAIINQAVKTFTKINKVIELRLPQIVSLILLLRTESDETRKALQITTGQGKSIVMACFAVLKCLQGFHVDIITTSEDLAERDSKYFEQFYKLFNLKVSNNTERESFKREGKKACYQANVVYGKIQNFQFDTLRHEYNLQNTRGERKFSKCYAIVDQIDNILIDDCSKMAMLSKKMQGASHLNIVFCHLWFRLQQIQQMFQDANQQQIDNYFDFASQKLSQQIDLMIKSNEDENNQSDCLYKFPIFLNQLIKAEKNYLIESLFTARYQYNEDHQYILKPNQLGIKRPCPLDFENTGGTQLNTNWGHGLHQFVEIKDGLQISNYSIMTNYISTYSFLQKYENKIVGLTGTLGSDSSRKIFTEIYKFQIYQIPQFKFRRLHKLDPIFIPKKQKLALIAKRSIEFSKQGRVVLVICQTKKQANALYDIMNKKTSGKIYLYSRNDNHQRFVVEHVYNCGDIIISTNLAGRGTDIKFSFDVEEKGGLHVIVGFLPVNQRVQQQAFGRAARQGQKGSAQIIEDLESVGFENKIQRLLQKRKFRQMAMIQNFLQINEPILQIKNKIFEKFCQLKTTLQKNKIIKTKTDKILHYYNIKALQERWGIFLKNIDYNQERDQIITEVDNFLKNMLTEFNQDQIIRNPYLFVLRANQLLEKSSYKDKNLIESALKSLEKGYALRGYKPSMLFYKIALCKLLLERDDEEVRDSLLQGLKVIRQSEKPQLEILMMLVRQERSDSDLMAQITSKIEIISKLSLLIEEKLRIIQKSKKKISITQAQMCEKEITVKQKDREKLNKLIEKLSGDKPLKVQLRDLEKEQINKIMGAIKKLKPNHRKIGLQFTNLNKEVGNSLLPLNLLQIQNQVKKQTMSKQQRIQCGFLQYRYLNYLANKLGNKALEKYRLAENMLHNFKYKTLSAVLFNLSVSKFKSQDQFCIVFKLIINYYDKAKINQSIEGEDLSFNVQLIFGDKSENKRQLRVNELYDVENKIMKLTRVSQLLAEENVSFCFKNLDQSTLRKVFEAASHQSLFNLTISETNSDVIQNYVTLMEDSLTNHKLTVYIDYPKNNINFLKQILDFIKVRPIIFKKNNQFSDLGTDQPCSISSLKQLISDGYDKVFEINQQMPIRLKSLAIVTCIAIAQIAVGIKMISVGNVGATLISEGVGDLIHVFTAGYNRNFTWKSYLTQKAVSLTAQLLTGGFSSAQTANGFLVNAYNSVDQHIYLKCLGLATKNISKQCAQTIFSRKAYQIISEHITNNYMIKSDAEIIERVGQSLILNFQSRFNIKALSVVAKIIQNSKIDRCLKIDDFYGKKTYYNKLASLVKRTFRKIAAKITQTYKVMKKRINISDILSNKQSLSGIITLQKSQDSDIDRLLANFQENFQLQLDKMVIQRESDLLFKNVECEKRQKVIEQLDSCSVLQNHKLLPNKKIPIHLNEDNFGIQKGDVKTMQQNIKQILALPQISVKKQSAQLQEEIMKSLTVLFVQKFNQCLVKPIVRQISNSAMKQLLKAKKRRVNQKKAEKVQFNSKQEINIQQIIGEAEQDSNIKGQPAIRFQQFFGRFWYSKRFSTSKIAQQFSEQKQGIQTIYVCSSQLNLLNVINHQDNLLKHQYILLKTQSYAYSLERQRDSVYIGKCQINDFDLFFQIFFHHDSKNNWKTELRKDCKIQEEIKLTQSKNQSCINLSKLSKFIENEGNKQYSLIWKQHCQTFSKKFVSELLNQIRKNS